MERSTVAAVGTARLARRRRRWWRWWASGRPARFEPHVVEPISGENVFKKDFHITRTVQYVSGYMHYVTPCLTQVGGSRSYAVPLRSVECPVVRRHTVRSYGIKLLATRGHERAPIGVHTWLRVPYQHGPHRRPPCCRPPHRDRHSTRPPLLSCPR